MKTERCDNEVKITEIETAAAFLADLSGQPAQYERYHYLSNSLARQDLKESLEAVQKDPNNPERLVDLAYDLKKLGLYEEALLALYEAEHTTPDNPLLLHCFALIYKRLNQNEYALLYAHAAYKNFIRHPRKYLQKPNDYLHVEFLKAVFEEQIQELHPYWQP